jgi:hypothetical protein
MNILSIWCTKYVCIFLTLILLFFILYQGTVWLSCHLLHVHMGRWKSAFAIFKGQYHRHLNQYIFKTWNTDIIRLQCAGWIRTQKTKFGTATDIQGERMWRQHAGRCQGFHQLHHENPKQYECEVLRFKSKQRPKKKLHLQLYLRPLLLNCHRPFSW